MANLSFFKFSAESWLTGKIQLLSLEEKGVFIELIARIWHNGGFIKNDEILPRLIRVDKATLSKCLAAFYELGLVSEKDGVLSIKFIDEQLKEIADYRQKQSAFGALGGRPKKGSPKGNKAYKEIRNKREDKDIEKENIYIKERFSQPKLISCDDQPKPPTSELKARVGKLFRRRESTQWTDKEMERIRSISKRTGVLQEMSELETLYNSDYPYKRKDIQTFLNNWSVELDRARLRAVPVPTKDIQWSDNERNDDADSIF